MKLSDFKKEFNILTFTVIADLFEFKATFHYFLTIFSIFYIYIFARLPTFFWFDFFYYLISELENITNYIEVRVYPMPNFLPVLKT